MRMRRVSLRPDAAFGGLALPGVLGALRLGTRIGPHPARSEPGAEPGSTSTTSGAVSGSVTGRDVGGAAGGARDAALVTDMRDRARRSGYAPATVRLLHDAWRALPSTQQQRVAAPLSVAVPRWRGEPAVQTDSTTCGAAVGAMLCAAGDPVLAYALETGVNLTRVRGANGSVSLADDARLVAASRGFAALQRHLHALARRGSLLGLLPWPRSLGTPPWGLAREVRWADVRYRDVVVDVGDPVHVRRLTTRISAHLREGVALPLWTGGSTATGWASAVPRHVVLLVGVVDGATQEGARWRVYEPSSGKVLTVAASTWAVPERRDAWGRWSRPHWILLPR